MITEEDPTGKRLLLNPTDTDITTQNEMINSHTATLLTDPGYWLQDMEYLYLRSFNELEAIFRGDEFKES